MASRKTIALIVAAGRGTRAGAGLPKPYRTLPAAQRPVLAATLEILRADPHNDAVLPVIHQDDVEHYNDCIKLLGNNKILEAVFGGESRHDSVRNGLEALVPHAPAHILVHDGVRPFVSHELIGRCLGALGNAHGAVPLVPLTDTLKRSENSMIAGTVSRDGLFRAQTPQAFAFKALLAAYRAIPAGLSADMLTDDAAIAELAGLQLAVVAGEAENVKLTYAEDFAPRAPISRTGNGFDVHRFGDAGDTEAIMLGGVPVPHDRPLLGHSDADVALHAITDALLGALSAGDIGEHFPPEDPAHADRDSADFLAHARALAEKAGARIVHVDLTLICERPAITPHKPAMRARIAEILGIGIEAVSVKATTTEGLGFIGRGEGIAAQATATITS